MLILNVIDWDVDCSWLYVNEEEVQKEPICTPRGWSRASVAFRGAFSCAWRQCALCKPREVSDDDYDAGESWVGAHSQESSWWPWQRSVESRSWPSKCFDEANIMLVRVRARNIVFHIQIEMQWEHQGEPPGPRATRDARSRSMSAAPCNSPLTKWRSADRTDNNM